ncbi:hypothetical protein DPMN_023828 [Dreissena polymorpha]|uniref:Uncharacterized protein n=1 Tax=Dreissena polymorpha TaxID=45954 RepID=A0A9D4LMU4_DREPO|nr:hypothetical protein DPMN_023828 [Dreissena polymorpha]
MQDMVTAIDTLKDTNMNCGIRANNMFVFACSDQLDSHTNAWYAVNPLAHEAVCQHPDLISSSRLRTYLATVYQVLEMEDRELELLSGHLHIDVYSRKAQYR